ncbi:MAG: carboxypeptidase regulatory-like domain-containing protein [Vicinamibacterales bacterium]
MAGRLRTWVVCGALAVLLPAVASAQSAFTGVVRDTSGAVLPGVTVEASSPVLIEGTRSTVTDSGGQYRITDLRPGVYTVTFSLPGFKQMRQEKVELRADFVGTLNGTLEVGALEEAITVTGTSPTVDVSSNSKVEVMTAEILEQVPTGRTIQALAQLVSGVSLNVPDVGGSRAMQQTYMSTRGLTSANNIVTVDGLMVNGLDGDGAVQQYFNQAMMEEMSYQTSGAGADVSPGGVRMNIVPKDGGNRFSGSFFSAWTDKALQGDNLTQDIIDRGLRNGPGIDRIYDFNLAIGGPILRDKLWFFSSGRMWGVDAPVADTFVPPSGTPYRQAVAGCRSGALACETGIDDQKIKSALLRLTWQISPKHKFSVYYDEIDKFRGHGMNAGDDPATASQIWTSPRYNSAAAKYTGTWTNQLLAEAGYSFNYEEYVITNQDGVNKVPFSPEWYANASRRDQAVAALTNGLANWGGRYPDRFNMMAALSYITGSHNIKGGVQYNWGPYVNTRETNADLQQVYNGTAAAPFTNPVSVTVYNTPLRYQEKLNADIGVFIQDSWALNRLTINTGLRWEYLSHEVAEQQSGNGRFVPERRFDAIPMPTWKDFAPRIGVVYDLFGNSKTALKASFNRYNESRTTQFATKYNPLALTSATLSWTDLNGDDIAQGERGCTYQTPGCEINFAQLPANFGVRSLATVDPDFQRTYNLEYTGGIQHELFPRVSVAATYYRRQFYDLPVSDNLLRTPADYRGVEVLSPLDGSVFTAYTVATAAQLAQVQDFDTNAGSGRKQIYNGGDITFNARLPRGGTLFGGFTMERTLRVTCDEPDDPNFLRFCDDRENDIPWLKQFKFAGTYPVGWGIQASLSFQSINGRPIGGFSGTAAADRNRILGPGYGDVGSPIGTRWLITRTTRYPNTPCSAPCVPGGLVIPGMTEAQLQLPLVPGGQELLDRINQVDVSLAKWFDIGGGRRVQLQADLFNALNANPVTGWRSINFATAAYSQVSAMLNPRVLRLGAQVRW